MPISNGAPILKGTGRGRFSTKPAFRDVARNQRAAAKVTAAPAFVLFLLIPAPLVLPVLSILSLVIACVAATYALFINANRDAQGSTIWNIVYVFTFTWIVAGMISNPKHVLDWFDNLPMVP